MPSHRMGSISKAWTTMSKCNTRKFDHLPIQAFNGWLSTGISSWRCSKIYPHCKPIASLISDHIGRCREQSPPSRSWKCKPKQEQNRKVLLHSRAERVEYWGKCTHKINKQSMYRMQSKTATKNWRLVSIKPRKVTFWWVCQLPTGQTRKNKSIQKHKSPPQ